MTAPFPFEAWAKPGKDAFEFWISFFPTAPLFGVEWRFAEMLRPEMNPFMQTGVAPVVVPFPGMRAAGAAARPGEFDTPAAADEHAADPVDRAAETAAETVADASRIAAETGRAAARTTEQAVGAGGAAADTAGQAAKGAAELAGAVDGPDERAADAQAEPAGRGGDGGGAPDITEHVEDKAEARARMPSEPATALDEVPGLGEAAQGASEAVDAAIAAAPRPEVLLDARPDEVDDLTTLKGVGAGLARQLNALGVWRLDQIARMSDADLAWIDAHLTTIKGRCFRDDWIGQAKSRLAR